MRILILNDSWLPEAEGGAGRVAFDMAEELIRRGEEVRVVTTTRNKNEVGEFEYGGIRGKKIYVDYNERWRAWKSLYNFKVVKELRGVLKEFKPDVIHLHNIHFYLSYACLKVVKKSGAKVFLTAHDVMSFSYGKLRTKKYLENGNYKLNWIDNLKQARKRYNPFRNIIIKYYLGFADKILAVSEALKEALEINGIKNVEVLYNGIDIEKWEIKEEVAEKFKRERGLDGKKVVLFGGRLSEAKGIKQIKKAMKIVKEKVSEAELAVFGGEIEEVVSLGWIEGKELREAYRMSETVVVSSVCFDSLPTVILEAMASKKAVIATKFGGSREIVEDGKMGYIVNPFDVEEMSEKIIELLEDDNKRLRFEERSYKRVKDKFSLEEQVGKLVRIYNR